MRDLWVLANVTAMPRATLGGDTVQLVTDGILGQRGEASTQRRRMDLTDSLSFWERAGVRAERHREPSQVESPEANPGRT